MCQEHESIWVHFFVERRMRIRHFPRSLVTWLRKQRSLYLGTPGHSKWVRSSGIQLFGKVDCPRSVLWVSGCKRPLTQIWSGDDPSCKAPCQFHFDQGELSSSSGHDACQLVGGLPRVPAIHLSGDGGYKHLYTMIGTSQ